MRRRPCSTIPAAPYQQHYSCSTIPVAQSLQHASLQHRPCSTISAVPALQHCPCSTIPAATSLQHHTCSTVTKAQDLPCLLPMLSLLRRPCSAKAQRYSHNLVSHRCTRVQPPSCRTLLPTTVTKNLLHCHGGAEILRIFHIQSVWSVGLLGETLVRSGAMVRSSSTKQSRLSNC